MTLSDARRTGVLLSAALAFSGILAGSDFDRFVIGAPAWQLLGPEAWADYSRHADLGRGIILYPVEAIGAALLTLAAAVSLQVEPGHSRGAAGCLWASSALAGIGLLLTLKAAPVMMGIATTQDAAALAQAFADFTFWSDWRAAAQILSFALACAAVAALAPRR